MKLSTGIKMANRIMSGFTYQYAICGSIRRCKPIVKDIDILVLREDMCLWKNRVPLKYKIVRGGLCDFDIMVRKVVVNFRSVPFDSWGSGLLFLTGSGAFNLLCRSKAKAKGLMLNRYGLWKGSRRICESELAILSELGLGHYLDPITRTSVQ